jgi:DNA processing protein
MSAMRHRQRRLLAPGFSASRRTGRLLPENPLSKVEAEAVEQLLGPLGDLERLNAPRQLYVAGDRALLRATPKVSIVGSRRASEEGLRRAAKLARILAEHHVVVVSGLAEGIDAAAHRSAIDNKGRTIAVIGTPLDECYPRKNAGLQAEIASQHLLVSQFAPGTSVRRQNFPIRNRTMALLVDASVIVEAGNTSGSLSQGWEVLRLGRALYIMKSVLERAGLEWPSKMLSYGAQVLDEPEELLEGLPTGDLAEISF